MHRFLKTVLLSCFLVSSMLGLSSAQTCRSYRFTSSNSQYSSCNDLPVLNSFLHWNYHPANHTADIAYRHTGVTSSQWVAWALNVGGSGMIGAQSLVAFRNSSGLVHAYTAPVSGYGTTLAEGPLSFNVPSLRAEYVNNEMIIYAAIQLPSGRTSFNQVWQTGPVSGDTPARHSLSSTNTGSIGTVNFATGQASGGGEGNVVIPRLHKKNIHGVLNVVSWGVLMPLGVIIARYMRVFESADPAWFYLHVPCQFSGYIVGVAGWATGIKLGDESVGTSEDTHRKIGITLFTLATLQVFALLLRPKKDHKYRFYWNVYHHSIGYTVIILSIINIFKGFDILDPEKKWKRAYIGVLIALGAIALVLEAFTWGIVLKRKKSSVTDKFSHDANGANGANGYGARSQQAV